MIEKFIIVTSYAHEMNFVFDRCYDTFAEAREAVENAKVDRYLGFLEGLQVLRIIGNDVEPYAAFDQTNSGMELDAQNGWWVLFGRKDDGEWGQTYMNTPSVLSEVLP
jgi:hypothetical protein